MSQNNPNITIHPASESERQLAALLLASSEPWTTLHVSLETCMANTHDVNYRVFIARDREEFAGVIILHDKGLAGSPYVKSIAIVPQYRGRGVGRQLLSFAEDLYQLQSKNIFLCVSSFNTSAQAIYQHLGWHKVGELKDYIVPGYDEWIFRKRLS